MNVRFPAVLKELNMTPAGIIAQFDISPPDLSILADLIDHEVTLDIETGSAFTPIHATSEDDAGKLPFEPEEDEESDPPAAPKSRKARKRPA